MAIVTLLFPSGVAASASNIYLAQNSAGAANGADCADALPYTFFNNSANWGTGANQIGPGTTVHICGTITTAQNSNAFTFQGSGSNGGLITLHFETGAIVQSPAFGIRNQAGISLNGNSYIVVDGGTNGQIQNTKNGTSGQTFCPAGACTIQQAADLVYADCGTTCEVKNLQIGPNYLVVQNGDSSACGFSNDGAVYMDNSGFSNVLIDNNAIHDGHWLIQLQIGSGTNLQLFNNNTYDADHLMAVGLASNSTINGFYIYDNIWGNLARWDNGSGCHHDSIHIFTQGANTSGTVQNLFIYDNEFDGPVGADPTAHIYLEPNGGTQTISTGWVFNNVLRYQASNSGECANGCANGLGFGAAGSVSINVLNNTLYGDGLGLCGGIGSSSVQGVTYGNAVAVDCNQLVGFGAGMPHFVSGQPDYNTYAQTTGGDAWQVGGSFFPSTQLTAYQAAIGAEMHSSYTASASSVLNTVNFTLATGSPAIGAAKNFFSACNGQPVPGLGALCNDKPLSIGPGTGATIGNARSSNQSWDGGAYSSGLSVSQPAPPAGLVASVN